MKKNSSYKDTILRRRSRNVIFTGSNPTLITKKVPEGGHGQNNIYWSGQESHVTPDLF